MPEFRPAHLLTRKVVSDYEFRLACYLFFVPEKSVTDYELARIFGKSVTLTQQALKNLEQLENE